MITLLSRSGQLLRTPAPARGVSAPPVQRGRDVQDFRHVCEACDLYRAHDQKCWDPRCKCPTRTKPYLYLRCPAGKWSKIPEIQSIDVAGPIDNLTGTGQIACGLISELAMNGIEPRIHPTSIDESWAKLPEHVTRRLAPNGTDPRVPCLVISPTNLATQPGSKEAWLTFWETDTPPAAAVARMNRCALGLFICEWNRASFIRAGVTIPTEVIPPFIAPPFIPRPMPDTDSFVFLAGGDVEHGQERKGIQDIIAAFKSAFPRNKKVRLRIKLRPGCRTPDPRDKRIELTREFLSPDALANWMAAGHVWVNACRGGAWELLPFQAMAMGRPIISTEYGSHAEYFDAQVGWPVDYTIVPATGPYAEMGNWSLPSHASLAAQMLSAYHAPSVVAEKGQAASARAMQYSLQRSGKYLANTLQTHGFIPAIPIRRRPAKTAQTWPSFYHSGDIGDLVFALWTMRALGGGDLYLGPQVDLPAGLSPRAGINRATYDFLSPLLAAQPYIHSLAWVQSLPSVTYDLNEFRLYWRGRLESQIKSLHITGRPPTLWHMHLARFGFTGGDESEPWLSVKPKRITGKPVIIHRSARYQHPAFDWPRVISTYWDKILFLGLPDEHAKFCQSFGQVDYHGVANALEMAQIIAGSKLYIGNASSPGAIAQALGVRCLFECRADGQPCDIMFDRPQSLYCVTGSGFTPPEI